METSSTSEASTRPIRVYYDGRRFLVWNTRDAYTLRCLHRIVGSLVGALPTNKRQTQEFGMPLSLLFEEALLWQRRALQRLWTSVNSTHRH